MTQSSPKCAYRTQGCFLWKTCKVYHKHGGMSSLHQNLLEKTLFFPQIYHPTHFLQHIIYSLRLIPPTNFLSEKEKHYQIFFFVSLPERLNIADNSKGCFKFHHGYGTELSYLLSLKQNPDPSGNLTLKSSFINIFLHFWHPVWSNTYSTYLFNMLYYFFLISYCAAFRSGTVTFCMLLLSQLLWQ